VQVIILPSAAAIGDYAADVILRGVTEFSNAEFSNAEFSNAEFSNAEFSNYVLGVATGSSPLPVYEALTGRLTAYWSRRWFFGTQPS
jgi:glucosamine-6-phosphate deaminase